MHPSPGWTCHWTRKLIGLKYRFCFLFHVQVIFIHGDCSYCEKVMSEFQNVARSAVYIGKLALLYVFFFHNNLQHLFLSAEKSIIYHQWRKALLIIFEVNVFKSTLLCFRNLLENHFPPHSFLYSFFFSSENLSVFLMNCSKSNTNKCKDYHVTGYPTLLLFRTIEAENSERCFHPDDLVEPSWIDYHGNFKVRIVFKIIFAIHQYIY